MKARGPTTLPRGWGARLPPRARPLPPGPPVASSTPTPPPYIEFRWGKNQREEIIVFYDTEPPPSPKTLSGELIWSPFGAPERGIRRRRHHQPSSITNFMMLTAVRE